MLSHEWQELEDVCDRISHLRHRYENAQRSKNVGLLEGLKAELASAGRQREMLVQHISARLGTHAGHHVDPEPTRASPETKSEEQRR
jgi:hypothetical protein